MFQQKRAKTTLPKGGNNTNGSALKMRNEEKRCNGKKEKNEYLSKRKRINFNTRHNLSLGVRELSIIIVFVWHVQNTCMLEYDTPQRRSKENGCGVTQLNKFGIHLIRLLAAVQ